MQSCSSPLWRKMRSHWPIWRVEPPPVERPLPEYARHRSRAALRGVDRSVDSQHFVVVVRCLGAVEESTGWSSLPTALPPSRLRSPRCYIQVSPGNCRKFWTDETISDRPNGLEVQRLPAITQDLLDLVQRAQHRHHLADLRSEPRRAAVVHPPEQQDRVHRFARLVAVTVAAEVGHADDDLSASRPKRDVAWALILERVARPLSQAAGLAPVLRVAERGLHRFGQQERGQVVGQFADGTLPRLEVLGRADDARVAAFGLDLLLDVSDFGPDLGESIARLLRSIL